MSGFDRLEWLRVVADTVLTNGSQALALALQLALDADHRGQVPDNICRWVRRFRWHRRSLQRSLLGLTDAGLVERDGVVARLVVPVERRWVRRDWDELPHEQQRLLLARLP